jgi:cystathionine gamma-synthase
MNKPLPGQTAAVRSGLETDEQFGAVVPPLYLSSNFTFEGVGQPRRYDYTRTSNPTRDLLADALTELEVGVGSCVTATGMGAITLVCQLVNPGELIVAPNDCYGGTTRLLTSLASRGLFEVELIDQSAPAEVERALKRNPKLIWVETPSNPLLRIVDIEAMACLAKRCGALLAVDNTFLSPALQQPLGLGADIVVHSTTKYLNGHSDVVGGAVVVADSDLLEQLQFWCNALGLAGSPFDSFLTLRGIRSLHARLRVHEENAHAIAEFAERHPGIDRVYYPGLPTHSGHDIASRQQAGFGGMVSLELRGGQKAARVFLGSLALFSLAESLGGVESLACHPYSMTHAAVDAESKRRAGIGSGLIRLSVGIEAKEDLLADIEQALVKVAG